MENVTKLRILYLYQYLFQNTDIDHPASIVELTKMLKKDYGISVSRNTISDDLTVLSECNLQIECIRSTQNKYYFDGQLLDIPELKLLIDAVSSSKFITEHKSEELINKLLLLVPHNNAVMLRRHIYAEDRVKSDNEKGYYIVDAINEAIDTGHKISFNYTDFDINKKRYVTNDGNPYTVSPYTMMWDGDYYYLRGYCDERKAMRTFRLDRIEKQPEILHELSIPKPESYDLAEFNKSVFQMYETEESVEVTLQCHVSTMKTIVDIFGLGVNTKPVRKEYFEAKVNVCISPTFFAWVLGFGNKIKIIEPKEVNAKYKRLLKEALEQ